MEPTRFRPDLSSQPSRASSPPAAPRPRRRSASQILSEPLESASNRSSDVFAKRSSSAEAGKDVIEAPVQPLVAPRFGVLSRQRLEETADIDGLKTAIIGLNLRKKPTLPRLNPFDALSLSPRTIAKLHREEESESTAMTPNNSPKSDTA